MSNTKSQNRRNRSRRGRNKIQKLDIPIKVKGSISDRKSSINDRKKHQNKDIFQQYDFTEEGNRLFNEFMDSEETTLNETEILLEKTDPIRFYKNLLPDGETNYGIEEMVAYWEMTGWFHECDNCFENTHNGDCKCINIVSKCDMTYMDTHLRQSRSPDRNQVAFILPKVVRNVPVLTLF